MEALLKLTKADVEGVLLKKKIDLEWTVLNYTLEGISDGDRNGFLGDHAILRVTVQSNSSQNKLLTFFVKFFPEVPSVAKFATEIGAFDKEFLVYDIFSKFQEKNISLIDMCVAKCYFKDPKKFFVMDNLIEAEYKSLNKMKTLDYDEVVVVLSSLAKLHASTLIYEEKISKICGKSFHLTDEIVIPESYFNDDPDFVNKIEMDASVTGILNSVDIFNFPKTLLSGKDFKTILKQVCNQIYRLVKPSTKYKNVLCHGDIWATNFLIKYDKESNKPINCKFVDFQCGRYVPPAHDVLAFLHLCTSREFRQKHMYNLIGMYYNYLEKLLCGAGLNVQEILNFDHFWSSLEEAKAFALVQTASYFPLILLSSKDVMNYFADEEIYQKAFLEDRSYLIMKHFENDKVYIERIRESIEDLKDYCETL